MCSKKAVKLTKLIASKLKDQYQDDCDKKELKQIFKEAVENLSKNEIKVEIQNNFDRYVGKFIKILNRREGHERIDGFPYNLYSKESLSTAKICNQADVCVWNYVAEKVQSDPSLISLLDESVCKSAVFPKLSVCHKLLRLTCGSKNGETLRQIMLKYYKEVDPLANERISDKDVVRCKELATEIKGFICVCHLRKKDCCEVDEKIPTYRDILASLLSIYTDLLIISLRSDNLDQNESKMLCNFVKYVLPWQSQQLDLLLQMTSVTKDDMDIIMPLLSAIFIWDTDRKTEEKYYLKYVLAVKDIHKKLGDAVESIVKSTLAIAAPKGFLSWLNEQKSELVEDFPHDKGFKKRKITKFLIEDTSEDQTDMMLEIFDCDITELKEEHDKIPNTELTDQISETKQDDKSKGNNDMVKEDLFQELFFIDKGCPSTQDNGQIESLVFDVKDIDEAENILFQSVDTEDDILGTSKISQTNDEINNVQRKGSNPETKSGSESEMETEIFVLDIPEKNSDINKESPRKNIRKADKNESDLNKLSVSKKRSNSFKLKEDPDIENQTQCVQPISDTTTTEILFKTSPSKTKERHISQEGKLSDDDVDAQGPVEKDSASTVNIVKQSKKMSPKKGLCENSITDIVESKIMESNVKLSDTINNVENHADSLVRKRRNSQRKKIDIDTKDTSHTETKKTLTKSEKIDNAVGEQCDEIQEAIRESTPVLKEEKKRDDTIQKSSSKKILKRRMSEPSSQTSLTPVKQKIKPTSPKSLRKGMTLRSRKL